MRMPRLANVAAIATLAATSCATKDDLSGSAVTGRVSQAIAAEYTITFPAGTRLDNVALLSSGTLRINDRVTLVDGDDRPAMAATTGPAGAELGSGAETGSIVSAGPVLVSGAEVTGNVTSAGLITLRNGGTVSGLQRSFVQVTPFQNVTIPVSFDAPSLGPIQLEPPNGAGERVTSVPPGHYSNVNIKSRNRVNLASGAYQFDSLTLEPQARLVIDDTAGPVYLDVKNSLLFKGAIDGASGKPPALRLMYVGTAPPSIESAFSGILIAPNTSMRLATPPDGKSYCGAFYARDLEVSPGTTVELRPLFEYTVVERWSVPTDTYGPFDGVMDAPDGAALFATRQRVYRRAASGVTTDLVGSELNCRVRFEPASSRWACATDDGVLLFAPEGTLLGQFDVTNTIGTRMVPPDGQIALFLGAQGATDRDEIETVGLRTADATHSATAALPNPIAVASASDTIVYSTGTDLVRMARSGSIVWTVPIALRQLVVSDDGNLLMGMRNQPGSTVVHIDLVNGSLLGEKELGCPMRELHFSPDGSHSLAATKRGVVAFVGGQVSWERDYPLDYLTSAAIADEGDVFVGGADTSGNGALFCDGPTGSPIWALCRNAGQCVGVLRAA